MPVTWVGENADVKTLGGDPVVPRAGTLASLAVGDLMLMIGLPSAAQTFTVPSGWAQHPNSNSLSRPLLYKFADAADVVAASFTFVVSGAANAQAVVSAYRGVDPGNPWAGTAGFVSTASTTVTIAAANPSVACYLAHLVGKLTVATWTPPALAAPDDWDHAVGAVGSTAGAHEMVASGSTGTRAWTASTGAAAGMGYIVPLNAAATTQTVSPGGIDSTALVGSPVVTAGAVTVSPGGIDSTALVGSPTVTAGAFTVSPGGIDSTALVGSPTVTAGAVTVSPGGIDSTALVGDPTVTAGTVTVSPGGIDSTALVGDPTVTAGAVTISPGGIDSTALVGEPAIQSGQIVSPGGIDSTALVGTPTVTPGGVTILPPGIDPTSALGTPMVLQDFDGSGELDHDWTLSGEGTFPARGDGIFDHDWTLSGSGEMVASGEGELDHDWTLSGVGSRALSGSGELDHDWQISALGSSSRAGYGVLTHTWDISALGGSPMEGIGLLTHTWVIAGEGFIDRTGNGKITNKWDLSGAGDTPDEACDWPIDPRELCEDEDDD